MEDNFQKTKTTWVAWLPQKKFILKSLKLRGSHLKSALSQCIVHIKFRDFIDSNWDNFQSF